MNPEGWQPVRDLLEARSGRRGFQALRAAGCGPDRSAGWALWVDRCKVRPALHGSRSSGGRSSTGLGTISGMPTSPLPSRPIVVRRTPSEICAWEIPKSPWQKRTSRSVISASPNAG
jgi:hypothetical protein